MRGKEIKGEEECQSGCACNANGGGGVRKRTKERIAKSRKLTPVKNRLQTEKSNLARDQRER